MSKPNIFTHATSELSQDAVLAWLLSWADAKSAEHDQELARLGRGFLELLFRRHDVSCPPSPEVVVEAQADRMDVRADVDGRYCILIEDKVGTVQHSDQLRTYINAVLSSGKYDRDNILPIYVQTHEQCVYDKVESARFKPVRRSDLLELFGEYRERGGKSDIALDFLDHLHGLERAFTAFRTTPVHDRWSSKAWTGFMAELRGSLYKARWGYVPNANGGFVGMWWHGGSGGGDATLYLQLENRGKNGGKDEPRLTFRLVCPEPESRKRLRTSWHHAVMRAAGDGWRVRRPRRFGNGRTMTIAELDGDYRAKDRDGLVDIPGTLETLKRAERILDAART